MKRILFSIFLIFLMLGTGAWAIPPSSIELNYHPETGVLDVVVHHVTHDLLKHRIRQITLYKNDQEIDQRQYIKQTDPESQVDQFMFNFESGDVIRVKAVCSKAGYGEESLVIP